MKPAPFDYIRAATFDEAAEVLSESGDEARILAGGQSLMAMLNMRLAQPNVLIDVMQVAGADKVDCAKGRLRIPAALRQNTLASRATLSEEVPLLAQMMPWIGHAQTRARGTICGSVAHADPSAELPLALAALEGQVHLRSRKKRRSVAARDFFLGMMLTEKADDELIEAVEIPLTAPGTSTAFREIGRRKGDFAIVSCAAIVRGTHIRLAVGGVNDTPVIQDWDMLDAADIPDALNAFAWSLDARDDLHATARYRRDLVRHLGAATLKEARACIA